MITVATNLLRCHEMCSSYQSDHFLKEFFVKEFVGRVISLSAACLFHAEAVSRAVKICFWVIQEVFSHLEDPWLTIPWLEREKEELTKTYRDSLYSFAETIYPHKLPIAETASIETEPVLEDPMASTIILPLPEDSIRPGARTPPPEILSGSIPSTMSFHDFEEIDLMNPNGQRDFTESRTPSAEDVELITPDAQQRFRESRTPSVEDVELMSPNAQRHFTESRTPSAEDLEFIDPNAQIAFREPADLPDLPLAQIHRPPQVLTDPIQAVSPHKSIGFPQISLTPSEAAPFHVMHIQPPPEVSTAPIHGVTPCKPIAFRQISVIPSEAAPFPVLHIKPPPRVSSAPIQVVTPSESVAFPQISLAPSRLDSLPVVRIQPPRRVSTDSIQVINPSKPILFSQISRAPSPEWENIEIPRLPLQDPSSTTMHTASSGEWSDLGDSETPRLNLNTPPTGTSTGRSTASILSHVNEGGFKPVPATPRPEETQPSSS